MFEGNASKGRLGAPTRPGSPGLSRHRAGPSSPRTRSPATRIGAMATRGPHRTGQGRRCRY